MNFLEIFVLCIYFIQVTFEARPGNRTRNFCPLITLKNGRTRIRGAFMQFMCNRGFTLAGEKYAKCLPRGTWDTEPPKCVKGTCLNTPKSPAHGYAYMSHKKAVYTFFCEPGYELLGPKATYCDGKVWDADVPSCIENGKQPALTCDFENPDLCGWNHDVNHDFDWIRHSKQTPSWTLGTGPSHDITKGVNGDGHYMYTEATSKNYKDTARLISPIYERSKDEDEGFCFTFYYHMYGKQTGDLSVYVREVNNQANLNLSTVQPLFTRSGDQGNAWHYAVLVLGYIKDEFQIVFEAQRGPGYLSDIAIDNVNLIPNCDGTGDLSFTTVSDENSTYLEPGSCFNRCGANSSFYQYGDTLACDCDIDCFLNGTCCPDFDVQCLSITDDFGNVTEETETTTYGTQMYTDESTDTTEIETVEDAETTTFAPEYPTNTDIKKNQTTHVNLSTNTTTAKPKIIKTVSTTTEKQAFVSIFINRIDQTTARRPYQTTTKKRQSTTPILKTTRKTTTRRPYKTTTKKRYTSKVPLRTTTKKPIQVKTTTLRSRTTTKPKTTTTTKKPNTSTRKITVIKYNNDTGNLPPKETYPDDDKKIYDIKADPSQYDKDRENGNHRTSLVIGLVSGAVIVCLFVVFLIQRYVRQMGRGGFLRRSCRSRSCGDSQSDVRYLTSDEILDFRLASSGSTEIDDYNTF